MTMQEYFDSTVQKILTSIGCIMKINIEILDHDTLGRKESEALGICYKNEFGQYRITIDEFFVKECYTYFVDENSFSTWELNGRTLEEVLCHELAHTRQWNHCKKHTMIMNELLSKVELPKKYYEYMKKRMSA